MSKDEMPDAEQLKQIFGVLTDSVPKLLDSVTKVLYGSQEGTKFGESVAAFYKALKDAGMSNEQAFELTKEYMSNLSIGGMLKNVVGGASQHGHDD
ncbi:MAG: hypothetical protein MIO90_00805 [Methanomassiliicoccales archaeon]|nr:hypothetical protein [Methanomassiliicoccales archaeon]